MKLSGPSPLSPFTVLTRILIIRYYEIPPQLKFFQHHFHKKGTVQPSSEFTDSKIKALFKHKHEEDLAKATGGATGSSSFSSPSSTEDASSIAKQQQEGSMSSEHIIKHILNKYGAAEKSGFEENEEEVERNKWKNTHNNRNQTNSEKNNNTFDGKQPTTAATHSPNRGITEKILVVSSDKNNNNIFSNSSNNNNNNIFSNNSNNNNNNNNNNSNIKTFSNTNQEDHFDNLKSPSLTTETSSKLTKEQTFDIMDSEKEAQVGNTERKNVTTSLTGKKEAKEEETEDKDEEEEESAMLSEETKAKYKHHKNTMLPSNNISIDYGVTTKEEEEDEAEASQKFSQQNNNTKAHAEIQSSPTTTTLQDDVVLRLNLPVHEAKPKHAPSFINLTGTTMAVAKEPARHHHHNNKKNRTLSFLNEYFSKYGNYTFDNPSATQSNKGASGKSATPGPSSGLHLLMKTKFNTTRIRKISE